MEKITIGRALHRFRARRGISQFDLAVCMDWKGTNPVIQIEKDRRMPRQDTLKRLGECLGLNYLEVHYLNGLAGYVPPTPHPPLEHVIKVLEEIALLFTEFPYPAYVLDYQLRFWLANRGTALLFNGDFSRLEKLMGGPLYVLDLIFDSRLGLRHQIPELEAIEQEQVFRFKAVNALRQHEDFFITFPLTMQVRLQPEDYQAFIRVWNSIDINIVNSYRAIKMQEMYAQLQHGDTRLPFSEGDVAFYIMSEPLLHLGNLFQIVTFVPVSGTLYADNPSLAEHVSQNYIPKEAHTLKLWELTNIQKLYPSPT
jgi:transcriptional regulator with XRE-family HTH domain